MVIESSDRSYDEGNKWERSSARDANMAMLGSGHSLDLPTRPDFSPAAAQLIQKVVDEGVASGGAWGFKDPRTVLTYSYWRPRLPPHRLVVVFRHPSEVASHYSSRRHPLRRFRGLRAWVRYNRELVRIVEDAGDRALVVNYSKLMTCDAEMTRIGAFVGVELVDTRRKALHRNRRSLGSMAWLLLAGPLGLRAVRLNATLDALSEQR